MRYWPVMLLAALLLGCSTHETIVSPAIPQVYINEIMAGNTNTVMDEHGHYSDWFELYNAGAAEVDLSGWQVGDADNAYSLPQGTVIAAGGYLLLWCDETGSGLHTNFKLSKTDDRIILKTSVGLQVDEKNFTNQTDDISLGRLPDGADNWTTFEQPTPGFAND